MKIKLGRDLSGCFFFCQDVLFQIYKNNKKKKMPIRSRFTVLQISLGKDSTCSKINKMKIHRSQNLYTSRFDVEMVLNLNLTTLDEEVGVSGGIKGDFSPPPLKALPPLPPSRQKKKIPKIKKSKNSQNKKSAIFGICLPDAPPQNCWCHHWSVSIDGCIKSY